MLRYQLLSLDRKCSICMNVVLNFTL